MILYHSIISSSTYEFSESLEILSAFDLTSFDAIEKVYKHFKNKQLDNFVGTIIAMVKPGVFHEPQKNIKQDSFNNFEQRTYNFLRIREKLLGWD